MTNAEAPNPLGLKISNYRVHGKQEDGEHHWVGADLILEVPPVGRYVLDVVTKKRYADENLEVFLLDTSNPEQLVQGKIEIKEPFVVNDDEITDEVLNRKFKDRRIEQDLADSMWYQGPLET